jgi:chaperonin GroES
MILEVLENKGVSNMEKYHSLMGELDGINFIKQELQSLLDKQEHIDERMPDPTGWRLLILPYRGKGKTEGGIYLPDKVQEETNIATVAGYVLKVGPLAYKDEEKFPNGEWCKKGDWVIFARYAGSRFRIEGGEVRILNDDEILATILDPEDILHF